MLDFKKIFSRGCLSPYLWLNVGANYFLVETCPVNIIQKIIDLG
jgi:hypothetical protein